MTRKQLFTLIATIVGSGIVVLDGTVVNLALPRIGADLHTGFSALQWIADGYLLTLSALILLGGSLGDIFGQRRVYFTGLIGFGAASLMCGLAPNAEALIGLRLVQGVFGALLVPSGLAIINTNFPPEMRGEAIGRWTAFSAIVTAAGPFLGGYLVDIGSWRWIFFINVPLVIMTVVAAKLGMAEHLGDKTRRLDYGGAGLAMVGLGALTYGLIQGPVSHWAVVEVAGVVGGLAVLGIFGFYERRRHDPMLKLELFRSNNFLAANISTFAMYGALGGFFFALGIYLQTVTGYTALQAGASLFPTTLILFLVSPMAGKWSAQHGPRGLMTAGPLIAAAGMSWLAFLGHSAPYLTAVLPGILLFAFGLSLLVAPLTSTVMGAVAALDSGIASGVNNAVARVAGLIVIAILGVFGAANSYHFGVILCTALAVSSGVVSFIMIKNGTESRV
ncbi:MAG: MFS transporter [Candidatus Saccharimonadales bacterium]